MTTAIWRFRPFFAKSVDGRIWTLSLGHLALEQSRRLDNWFTEIIDEQYTAPLSNLQYPEVAEFQFQKFRLGLFLYDYFALQNTFKTKTRITKQSNAVNEC